MSWLVGLAVARDYMPFMKTRTKKQHLVPRFCLERFTDQNGLVWTYARGKTPFGRIAAETGLETNFYTPIGDNGERIDDVELLLGDIEDAAAPLWERLMNGEVFEGDDREIIAIFVAAQYLRSPAAVSAGAELSAQLFQQIGRFTAMHEQAHEASMDDFDAHTGKKTSPEERTRMREFMMDTNTYQINVSRDARSPSAGLHRNDCTSPS